MVHMVKVRCILAVVVSTVLGSTAFTAPADLQGKVDAAFGRRAGGAVVMRVSDGRMLAVANSEVSCRTLHAPGSIFKLVTAYAALREGVARGAATFRCGGQARLDGALLHCTVPNGHGRVTFPDAIAKSCNVSFYQMGAKLGAERLLKYARLFGLNAPCSAYAGRQATGKLPPVPLHPAEVARLAIGQAKGFGITLLEAAEMVRRIAADKVSGSAGADLSHARSDIAIVRKGMRLAVLSGTCKRAAVKGVAVAGKTGTAEAADNAKERSAWFVGFAPYDKPEVVVVVFVKRGHGYDTAAPIAGRIFASYFGRAGVP